ncbi:hypothetical protein JS533_008920 [Bifidobacterium amazonense]|uniref:Sialate O-acetylesterase domain-containing protein n=1 Tax=Bifidobacterium amazonense TaxID=2809027 RepID=A0ABS9VWA4_9BIFI|nr:sialate O-acetylesterase [Bifidobacterium amazonense]MCH9276385.1 hypothetical protein [Bifidobacterium amazonense]
MTLHITPLVSDHCLIQRDRPVAVWGISEPGSTVTATLATVASSTSAASTVGEDGRWEAVLPAQTAGTEATITVTDGETAKTIRDVLFGDVWLLAGQSNMEMRMERIADEAPHLMDDADDGNIRWFNVPQVFDFQREHGDLDAGEWFVSARDRPADMSAIGWFFARKLREMHDVPIGLVNAAVGGSKIETWMSRERLESMGALPDDFGKYTPDYVARQQRLFAEAAAAYDREADDADTGLNERWQDPDFDDSDWGTMELAESERPELQAPGIVWLRKRITVPDRYTGQPAQLRFGTIHDADRIYLDGEPIGETFYQYPPRDYDIAALPKTFTLAIRLKVEGATGGFTAGKRHLIVVGDALERDLTDHADPDIASLDGVIDVDALGAWRFRRSVWMPVKPNDEFFRMEPVGDYNAMIVPLRRLGLTGVLWYQGESNCWHPYGYAELQMALIQDWRRLFAQGDFPFIYAQLPNYRLGDPSSWLYLRDEQRKALAIADTAMVTTYDAGEDSDLHPFDKKTVAERMAAAAETLAYGGDCEPMGPTPCWVHSEPNRLVVRFTHVGDGLRATGPLRFDIVNGTGLPRVATFDGRIIARDRIAIDLPLGTAPGRDASLRFLWAPTPAPVLENSDGLLATPFAMPID